MNKFALCFGKGKNWGEGGSYPRLPTVCQRVGAIDIQAGLTHKADAKHMKQVTGRG